MWWYHNHVRTTWKDYRWISYRLMQSTLYSNDSVSHIKHLILVIHPTVVSCCVRMASSNGESGIREAGVCNSWRLTVTSPSICHPLPRWLWVYEAGEVHSRSNGVWTTGRICDHSHHWICMELQIRPIKSLMCVNIWQFFTTILYLDNTQPDSTLTNDSHIPAMVTVELPHTTPAALCQVRFSPSTVHVSKDWSTPLSKVSCKYPYKHSTS